MNLWAKKRDLIRFSRIHTVIGTLVASIAIFLLVVNTQKNINTANLFMLSKFLIMALCLNLYVVGINQIYDVEVDRINKPELPLTSNSISIKAAWSIVIFALSLAWILALTSKILLITAGLITIIGYMYSVPPFRVRNHYFAASFLIIVGRGFLLNLSAFLYFTDNISTSEDLKYKITYIILFFSVFTLIISVFKDLPDTEGDKIFNIKTSPIKWGVSKTFTGALSLLALNNVIAMLFILFALDLRFEAFILLFHLIVIVGIFVAQSSKQQILASKKNIHDFYQKIWVLFYIEYIIIVLAF